MPCTIKGLNLNPKEFAIVEGVANGNDKKAAIIAAYLKEDANFIEFASKDSKWRGSIENTPHNTCVRLLNEYYKKQHPSVVNFRRSRIGTELNGFSSVHAKYIAYRHTAGIISALYYDLAKNKDVNRKDRADILRRCGTTIRSKFVTEYINPLINSDEFKNNSTGKKYIEKINDLRRKANQYKAIKDKENFENTIKELYTIYGNIAAKYGDIKTKNYGNLVNKLLENKEAFYEEVINNSSITFLTKTFKDVSDIINAEKANNEEDINFVDEENDGIDEMMKSHIEDLTSRGSYLNTVSQRLKLYFETIPNLESAESKTLDLNNELGVEIPIGYNKAISAIYSFCTFTSPKSLIEEIKNVANNISHYAGLIKLAEDMENDIVFRNYVFGQLANPKVNKTIISISESGIEFSNSNATADPITAIFYQYYNAIKGTIRTNYPAQDLENIQELYDYINLAKKEETGSNAQNDILLNLHNKFLNIYLKYFPNAEVSAIDKYINDGNKIDNYTKFISIFDGFLNEAKKSKDKYEQEILRNNKNLADYYNRKKYAIEAGIGFDEERPVFKIDDTIFGDAFINSLYSISNSLVKYSVVKVDLNSRNADGNLGADFIGNSWITNLFKQINFSTEEDLNAGLNKLREFISLSNQYKYNPILFDQYDERGRKISRGLFDINEQGETFVNTYARQLLDYTLFNGIKDYVTDKSALYSTMSKTDYLISQLISYTTDDKIADINKGWYFMRTPSDAPKNFIIKAPKHSISGLFNEKSVNKKHPIFRIFYNYVLGELEQGFKQLTKVGTIDNNGIFTPKDNTDGLFEYYHYRGSIIKNGKLTGNVFQFNRLFPVNGFNPAEILSNEEAGVPFLYGGKFMNTIYSPDGANGYTLNLDDGSKQTIENIVEEWLINYSKEIEKRISQYTEAIGDRYNIDQIKEFAINYTINTIAFDNIFEGDSKFYKSYQDFLKRAKEVQAQGKAYTGYDLLDDYNGGLKTIDQLSIPRKGISTDNITIPIRNGFKAITINNTVRGSNRYVAIKKELINIFEKEYGNKELTDKEKKNIEDRAEFIARGYKEGIITNDAQSYITFEEFIRRRVADGTYYEYADLITQLLDPNIDVKDIDLDRINAKIQVQKNFYFDHAYDATTETYYPRQIKNAEFVLIPKLLPKDSSLYQLYELMTEYGIDQVNTKETDKAAKKDVLTFWDNEGNVTEDNLTVFKDKLNEGNVIGTYYYRYLYKQQDVPQHMVDASNKVAVQLFKKIIDNTTEETAKYVNTLFKAYCKNIEDSFNELLNNLDLKVDKNRNIVNKNNSGDLIDFNSFYKRAQEEAKRLNLDSNFLDYVTPDPVTHIPRMPNFMNYASIKLQSIAQSIFNNSITKQKLPGWHAAQITNVGFSKKLEYHPTVYNEVENPYKNVKIELTYTPDTADANGMGAVFIGRDENGNAIGEFYIDAYYDFNTKSAKSWRKKDLDENKVSLASIGQAVTIDEEFRGKGYGKAFYYQIAVELGKQGKTLVSASNSSRTEDANRVWKSLVKDGYAKKVNDHYEFINNKILSVKQEAYIEVMLPRWSKLLPKNLTKEQLDHISKEGLDLHLGYRMPTEGKQSIAILKVVGFLDDSQGSTIVVPDEWVPQTGSDFDVDSVYGICYEMYFNPEDALIHKIEYNDGNTDEDIKYRYKIYKAIKNPNITLKQFKKLSIENQNTREARNNLILDCIINIFKSQSAKEENYSQSNFRALEDAKNNIDKLREHYEELIESSDAVINRSTYNLFDQLDSMENAMSGARLKAASVNRDTFVSICNYAKTKLSKNHIITIKYPNNEIYNFDEIKKAWPNAKLSEDNKYIIVEHDSIGNTVNNKNIVGQLLTTYGSQTTAHILDAIKSDTVYNENEYTFGVFKTLLDIGSDYITAIAFLQQPAVTEIVNAYFKTNSIFTNIGNKSPIKVAITELAKKYNIKVDGKEIADFTSTNDILGELTKLYGKEFKNRFGIDLNIDYLHLTNNVNVNLSQEDLLNRFSVKDDFLFDLYIIIQFNKLKITSNNIEKILQVTKSDKFGAKQTIRSTRRILQDAKKYTSNRDLVGSTLYVKDKTFVDALYPNIIDENINIENSVYPYLAAFMQYATIPSIKINSQLFTMEREDVAQIIDNIEQKLNVKLNDEQYIDLIQYMVSYLYKLTPILTTPITLNEMGKFITDTKYGEELANENIDYWKSEEARINGFTYYETTKFDTVDINNPTQEEINNFAKLTPVQKVLYIKEHFSEDPGIFKYIDVNTYNQRNVREKGYTGQSLYFHDNIENIEDILIQSKLDSFNKHPYIKLAMLDIVKYAFIVDGFRFKRNSITKLVVNEFLLKPIQYNGTNIVPTIIDNFATLFNVNDFDSKGTDIYNMTERFVRSHSGIIKNVFLSKKDNRFNKFFKSDNIVQIPYTKDGISFIEYTGIGKWVEEDTTGESSFTGDIQPGFISSDSLSYIRITRNINKKSVTTLYKVIIKDKGLYLAPLNLLDNNETNEYSINPNHNKFKRLEYYLGIIDAAASTESDINIIISQEDGPASAENKAKYTIKRFIQPKINDVLNNRNYFTENLSSTDPNGFINKLINKFKENSDKALIADNNKIINFALPNIDSATIQTINGEDYYIKKVKPSNNLKLYFKTKQDKYYNKLNEQEKNIADTVGQYSLIVPNIYEVSQYFSPVEENIEDIAPFAITDIIGDSYETIDSSKLTTVEEISLKIINDINRQGINGNEVAEKVAELLKESDIDRYSAVSIKNHTREIYSRAAGFYKTVSNMLNKEINNFIQDENGEWLSIDNPKVIDIIKNKPGELDRYVRTLLNARSFGTSLSGLFEFDIASVDKVISDQIQSIRNSINNIRNNPKIVSAMKLIMDNYFGKEVSTNPLIRNNIISIRTQYSDADIFDSLFSSVSELSNSEVQVIVKFIGGIINGANLVDAPKARQEFLRKYDEIMKMPGKFVWNDIVKNGKFITPYTQKFITDRDQLRDAVREAKDKYGRFSIEYYKARLNRDKWYADNVNMEVVPEYYIAKNKLDESILKTAPELFVRYKEIMTTIYEMTPGEDSELSIEQQQEKIVLINEINFMTSSLNKDYSPKSDEEIVKANALKDYIDKIKKLNGEYFEYSPIAGFDEDLKYYLDIIKKYDENNPNEVLEEKLKDENYRNAFNWINLNARKTINKELKDKIDWAFKQFKDNADRQSEIATILDSHPEYKDKLGIIDGRKFTKEQKQIIKDAALKKYGYDYESSLSNETLIKEIPANLPILSSRFYTEIRSNDEGKRSPERIETISKINDILQHAVDRNGEISTKLLFNLPKERIEELANLYDVLRDIRKNRPDYDSLAERFKDRVNFRVNRKAFNRELSYALLNLKGTANYDLWERIFCAIGKNGEVIIKNKKIVPNSDLFGYYEPKSQDYIDHNKTLAKKIISDNVDYITTEYYERSRNEAIANNNFEEWFEENHVFNPYTRKYEPLRIWTTLDVKNNLDKYDPKYYDAIGSNRTRYVKEEYKNKNYKSYSVNYNGSEKYNNKVNLSSKEVAMIELLQSTLNEYATTNPMKRFIDRGYLPRRRKDDITTQSLAKDLIGLTGYTINTPSERRYEDDVDYAHDREVDFPMLQLLKAKGYKKRIIPRTKLSTESQESYNEYLADIKKQNKEIDENNEKLDNAILDDNWKEVFQEYITKAIDYNARQRAKYYIYLLLDELKSNDAYKTSYFSGKLKRDNANSTDIETKYQTEKQTRTIELINNFYNRIVLGEFKKGSKLDRYANLMQNITSAKYMIFNVTGGIGNVLTGWTNIAGEVFAKEFFDNSTWNKAQARYFGALPAIIANLYSPKALNLTDGIIKLLRVVDIDNMLELKGVESATDRIRKIRDSLYGLQSSGEHYMQNTAMLAMLESHRVIKDNNGNWYIGSFANFTRDLEIQTMCDLIKDNPELLASYRLFIDNIRSDANEAKSYAEFSKDINAEFIKAHCSKAFANEYIKNRDANLKSAKKEFERFDTLASQFELVDGVARIKPDSVITKDMFGRFRDKVINVNNKIHGIYDKIGAAKIEAEWYGGLVMQYKKHLYPGILKRWRVRGYYNEMRESIERGSYIDLISFLAHEFKDDIKNAKAKGGTTTDIVLHSIQNIFKSFIDTFINFRFNYKMLPDWQQHNLRRILGDSIAIASAILMAIVLHLATDDDDEEVINSTWYNLILYQADRWATESRAYTPWGFVAEAKTLYSSPIAALSGPKDLFKAMSLIIDAMIDPEFDPVYDRGLYKGQNKFTILLEKNIPLLRVIRRLQNLDKNNQFYRLSDNNLPMDIATNVANWIED